VRELLPGPVSGGFYLVGWHGLFRTDDAGRTWTELGAGLPGSTADRLVNSPLGLLALAAGDIWVSRDGGRGWEVRQAGLPAGQLQAVGYAAERPSSLWAAGANHVFRTDDAGLTWQSIGRALPDGGTRIHRIAVDAGSIVLSTDHGLYRMREGGQHWEPLVDNLPGHIEAGPLVRDDRESSTLYVGFSVTPYAEIWRNSAEGGSALGQLGASELVGGGAFLGLLGVCAWVALRWLARRGRPRFTGGVA
jgi:photosystem II stability/assembly factor-like uncharacterized protein